MKKITQQNIDYKWICQYCNSIQKIENEHCQSCGSNRDEKCKIIEDIVNIKKIEEIETYKENTHRNYKIVKEDNFKYNNYSKKEGNDGDLIKLIMKYMISFPILLFLIHFISSTLQTVSSSFSSILK